MIADGNHHFASGSELLDKCLGHVIGCGRHHDHVERSFRRPTMIPIAMPDLDVRVIKIFQPLAGLAG